MAVGQDASMARLCDRPLLGSEQGYGGGKREK